MQPFCPPKEDSLRRSGASIQYWYVGPAPVWGRAFFWLPCCRVFARARVSRARVPHWLFAGLLACPFYGALGGLGGPPPFCSSFAALLAFVFVLPPREEGGLDRGEVSTVGYLILLC